MPALPLAPILSGILPTSAQSDEIHCRPQAPRHARVAFRRPQTLSLRLYIWQRLTAALMAPLVLVHVAVIFYASRKGLTAADILGRTRGSIMWASFYGAFVAAAALHAAIGVRNVLTEWSPLGEGRAGMFSTLFGVLLLVLGLRAVA